MKPQRERSGDVGPGRLGGISSSFHAHGNEGLLPVSDECWMVHRDPYRMQSVWCFQIFLINRPPRSSVGVDISSGEIGRCATITKMQSIFEFHIRNTSPIDITWWGLQPFACFLASEICAFGCCWQCRRIVQTPGQRSRLTRALVAPRLLIHSL